MKDSRVAPRGLRRLLLQERRSFIKSVGWIGVVAAVLTAIVHMADRSVALQFKPLFGGLLHLIAVDLTEFGKADPYFALAGLGLVLGWILRQPRVVSGATGALSALVVSGLLVQVLKHVIGRQRPYADASLTATNFDFFTPWYEWHSLPSGHSQVAFTVATTMVLLGPNWRAWRWAWFILATAISLTRVITLNHWLSDIVAGAAIGVVGTLLGFRLALSMKYGRRCK